MNFRAIDEELESEVEILMPEWKRTILIVTILYY